MPLWMICLFLFIFFFKQKTAYEMRISDWSSDVCSSDLRILERNSARGVEFALAASILAAKDAGINFFDSRDNSIVDRNRVAVEIGRASCRERVCQYV